jgi:hypothetical protein
MISKHGLFLFHITTTLPRLFPGQPYPGRTPVRLARKHVA